MTRATQKTSRYLGGSDRHSQFPRRILIANHGEAPLETLSGSLATRGHTILATSTQEETLKAIAERRPDMILLAPLARSSAEAEVLDVLAARTEDQQAPVILLSDEPLDDVLRFTKGQIDDVASVADPAERIFDRALLALVRLDRLRATEDQLRSLERQSITDFKTGTFNDRYFHRRMREEFGRAQRYRATISVVMLDFDNFKEINDTFDHAFGDFVLLAFANKVRSIIRDSDIPARFGGDEFVVLLPNTGMDEAAHISERIRTSMAEYDFERDGRSATVAVSIGIATFNGADDFSPEEFLRRADCALLEAKRRGRNRVVQFPEIAEAGIDPELHQPPRRLPPQEEHYGAAR